MHLNNREMMIVGTVIIAALIFIYLYSVLFPRKDKSLGPYWMLDYLFPVTILQEVLAINKERIILFIDNYSKSGHVPMHAVTGVRSIKIKLYDQKGFVLSPPEAVSQTDNTPNDALEKVLTAFSNTRYFGSVRKIELDIVVVADHGHLYKLAVLLLFDEDLKFNDLSNVVSYRRFEGDLPSLAR